MTQPAITGTGVFTPDVVITNDELIEAFNAYADLTNAQNAEAIATENMAPVAQSSAAFILSASGIEPRYVMDKSGILGPTRMMPRLPARSDGAPCLMAEMAVDAISKAWAQAGRDAAEVDLVICAASNHERAYPAVAVEIQNLIGAGGFAFDMNVACSSATFGIQGQPIWAGGKQVCGQPTLPSPHANAGGKG